MSHDFDLVKATTGAGSISTSSHDDSYEYNSHSRNGGAAASKEERMVVSSSDEEPPSPPRRRSHNIRAGKVVSVRSFGSRSAGAGSNDDMSILRGAQLLRERLMKGEAAGAMADEIDGDDEDDLSFLVEASQAHPTYPYTRSSSDLLISKVIMEQRQKEIREEQEHDAAMSSDDYSTEPEMFDVKERIPSPVPEEASNIDTEPSDYRRPNLIRKSYYMDEVDDILLSDKEQSSTSSDPFGDPLDSILGISCMVPPNPPSYHHPYSETQRAVIQIESSPPRASKNHTLHKLVTTPAAVVTPHNAGAFSCLAPQFGSDPYGYTDETKSSTNLRPHTMSFQNHRAVGPRSNETSRRDNAPSYDILSPLSPAYEKLSNDPAFWHACNAGVLWQSLVSQHVKMPSSWWNADRRPLLGSEGKRPWNYIGRHRVEGNNVLNEFVHNRGSAGRILLHIVVQDLVTLEPVQDIAIGCFHPSARGIRRTTAFDPDLEQCRDVWIGLRQRKDEEESVMEALLRKGNGNRPVDSSPLGSKYEVTNNNMRSVFGEQPPIQTMYIRESDLFETLSGLMGEGSLPPALLVMQEYLRSW